MHFIQNENHIGTLYIVVIGVIEGVYSFGVAN